MSSLIKTIISYLLERTCSAHTNSSWDNNPFLSTGRRCYFHKDKNRASLNKTVSMDLDIALKNIKQKIYELNRNEPRMHRNSHLRLGFHFCNIHLSVYRFGSIVCDKSASSLTLPNTAGFLWNSPACSTTNGPCIKTMLCKCSSAERNTHIRTVDLPLVINAPDCSKTL